MDFRKATNELLAGISHEVLAEALGKSVPSIRQARLDEAANAYRKPPAGWERAVIKLALQRAKRLTRLAAILKEQSSNEG
jgi:hypothetical protein